MLEAMKRIDYAPPRQFFLFPAPGPTLADASANGATSLTWFEDHEPFTRNAGAADFITAFNERAQAAGMPWPHVDYQAAAEFAAWQILEAAVAAVGRIDEKAMAEWLRANTVNTVFGPRSFQGRFNSGEANTKIRQVQNGKWVTVWPANFRPQMAAFLSP
jgi:branched-chain amino acid transport system substrate-binding protein